MHKEGRGNEVDSSPHGLLSGSSRRVWRWDRILRGINYEDLSVPTDFSFFFSSFRYFST